MDLQLCLKLINKRRNMSTTFQTMKKLLQYTLITILSIVFAFAMSLTDIPIEQLYDEGDLCSQSNNGLTAYSDSSVSEKPKSKQFLKRGKKPTTKRSLNFTQQNKHN
jgi:hypothetical protein